MTLFWGTCGCLELGDDRRIDGKLAAQTQEGRRQIMSDALQGLALARAWMHQFRIRSDSIKPGFSLPRGVATAVKSSSTIAAEHSDLAAPLTIMVKVVAPVKRNRSGKSKLFYWATCARRALREIQGTAPMKAKAFDRRAPIRQFGRVHPN